jgi:hypothetical protein
VCKRGWYQNKEWVNIAMGVLMDCSPQHSQIDNGTEIVVHLTEEDNAFARQRVIMYAPWMPKPVFTDYVLVACCHRIGSYMM